MSKEYKILKQIYTENEGTVFNLAVEWLMENGYLKFRSLTDEMIEEAEAPNIIAPEMFKHILKIARQIANETNPMIFRRLMKEFNLKEIFYSKIVIYIYL